HKRIGIMYGYAAFFFLLVGGIEALLLRIQLASPDNNFLSAAEYNAMFTMHGTTMIFLAIMPISAAFFNYLLPLQIGARDVAFPRLNALSFWIFIFGGVFLYSTFLFGTAGAPEGGYLAEEVSRLGSAPNGGWFGYQPNAGMKYSPGTAMDYWAIGLQILGIASLVSAFNFITTILNMRTKGMRFMRMPVFTWMTFAVSFLLAFSLPIIAIALFYVTFDRQFGTTFFLTEGGGDPILWQHLFWLFGHPEVYILILPAFGIVSEVLPTFSRKPLFGYPAIVFAGFGIAFIGFGVWAHHMFASAISPVAQAGFGLSTMVIAVPTGVKIFNWLGTIWGGKLSMKTPMLFSLGFIGMFLIGGLSGVTHAIVPADTQQTDTYYVVAHFHYVLFGGAMFGIFSGLYYWFPKVWGKMYNETLGKIHFWLMMIGFNLTFGPMHWLGLQGQVRRTWVYAEETNLAFWNLIVSIGAFIIALSILVFMANWIYSRRKGPEAGFDPWDARTIEWSIPSPTPVWNFSKAPEVKSLDDFWHMKYDEDEEGRPVKRDTTDALLLELEEEGLNPKEDIELPNPSYFPIILASGLPFLGYAVIYKSLPLAIVGVLLILIGSFGWGTEPLEEEFTEDTENE
ncbi:MAG: cytochrome c oxidase subunit I, partial [Actinobacteria bacterium]|nr:cytochrome c oxidase subunit I [Actinomycetota bacterium]